MPQWGKVALRPLHQVPPLLGVTQSARRNRHLVEERHLWGASGTDARRRRGPGGLYKLKGDSRQSSLSPGQSPEHHS